MRNPINKLDRRPPMLSRRHIDVVLMEPQKCENIGAAARAMANMGLGRLQLVRPRSLNWNLIETTATSHASRILSEITIHQELDQAMAPYGLVVGTTARVGNRRGPFYTPRQLAAELLNEIDDSRQPTPVAILFGPERMGLATEDMRRCQKVVRIPTDNPETSSLNLAQAVLLIGYELIVAAGGEPAPPKIVPASQADLNGMYDDLTDVLLRIGFLPADNPGHWLMNIKKIFNRSLLTNGECNLWRGICRQLRWALDNPGKLPPAAPAGQKNAQGQSANLNQTPEAGATRPGQTPDQES